jgi:uncharacterized protein
MSLVGAPRWVDLSAADVAAEAAFYSKLVGWEYGEPHPDAGGWIQAEIGGKAAAGIMPRPPQLPVSVWSIYFGTDDIEAAIARAVELGATVMFPPMSIDIGGEHMCTIAMLFDPIGAAFGLTEAGVHTGFEVDSGQGSSAWFEMMSRDPKASIDFYTQLLGATAQGAPDVPMEYTQLAVDGRDFGGVMAMPEGMPETVPSNWTVYFAVDDADAAVARAVEAGATIFMGPETMSAGRLAAMSDPEGAYVCIIKLASD